MSDSEALDSINQTFHGHYAWVLGTLLALLALYPFVDENSWLNWFLDAGFLLVIVSCFLVALPRRYWRLFLMLAFAAEIFTLLANIAGIEALSAPSRLLRILVLCTATVVVLLDVLRAKRVTMDTVFAAASVYLLMAIVWSTVFVALETIQPGSFALGPTDGRNAMSTSSQLVYFSLITLTTVGYGDITPASPQASFLAALEGLIGQLFIAIILARLVALELTGRPKNTRGDEDR